MFLSALNVFSNKTSKIAETPKSFLRTNTIFIHIPKCAGQSIGQWLYGHTVHHTSVTGHIRKNPEFFKQAFVFTVVRDPVDRFLSAWNYVARGGRKPSDQKYVKQLEAFTLDTFLDHMMENGSDDFMMFRSQSSYVTYRSKTDVQVDKVFKLHDVDRIPKFLTENELLPANWVVSGLERENIAATPDAQTIKKSELTEAQLKKIKHIYDIDYSNFF